MADTQSAERCDPLWKRRDDSFPAVAIRGNARFITCPPFVPPSADTLSVPAVCLVHVPLDADVISVMLVSIARIVARGDKIWRDQARAVHASIITRECALRPRWPLNRRLLEVHEIRQEACASRACPSIIADS